MHTREGVVRQTWSPMGGFCYVMVWLVFAGCVYAVGAAAIVADRSVSSAIFNVFCMSVRDASVRDAAVE